MYDVVGIATPCMDLAMNVTGCPPGTAARLENYSFKAVENRYRHGGCCPSGREVRLCWNLRG